MSIPWLLFFPEPVFGPGLRAGDADPLPPPPPAPPLPPWNVMWVAMMVVGSGTRRFRVPV